AKRLSQIVVSATLEPRDRVVQLDARGQHDHRQRRTGTAELLQNLETVEARKIDVEDEQIELVSLSELEGRRAGCGHCRRETGGAQSLLDEPRDARFVIRDQDGCHGSPGLLV